jgi:hypothetical protein
MLALFTNLRCPKSYHKPDHSIHFDEYQRKVIIVVVVAVITITIINLKPKLLGFK